MYYVKNVTVYYGTQTESDKSGINRWAKVILHAMPARRKGNEVLTMDLFTQPVAIWVGANALESVLALEELGTPIASEEGKSSKGFKLVDDAIPEAWRTAFADFDCELHFKRIDFDKKMRKVKKDGTTVMKNGNAVISDHITVGYWVGGIADDSGSYLSEAHCTARALEEWKPLMSNIVVVDDFDNNDDDNEDKGEIGEDDIKNAIE